tara:strand:+ start:779 stop:1423 length:645 start_codon:yes stop_codon:yes gene_type:complete
MRKLLIYIAGGLTLLALTACQSAYYSAMESAGFAKRDILVGRVEDARDSQADAQAQFASALEQFSVLIDFDGGELQAVYEDLDDEYEASESAAAEVTDRIDAIERVADDLFDEWRDELTQYSNVNLRRDSERKLKDTERRYQQLITSMKRAEKRMTPVLDGLRDNVLYLKHNLNASAIGALQDELGTIEADVSRLIAEMNTAIAESDAFIDSLQ